jgi:uncharacterized protein (DUF4415 family)
MARPTNRFRTMIKTARGEQEKFSQEDGDDGVAVKKLGRPVKGKSSNPAYESTTIYLDKDVKHRAGRILYENKAHGGFSDVMNDLLRAWVDRNI